MLDRVTDEIPTAIDHPELVWLFGLGGLIAALGVLVGRFRPGSLAAALLAIGVFLVVSAYVKGVVLLIQTYSAHPILFGLVATAGHFAGLGVAAEVLRGHHVAGAFLVIYGLIALFLGAGGYAILVAARVLTRVRGHLSPV